MSAMLRELGMWFVHPDPITHQFDHGDVHRFNSNRSEYKECKIPVMVSDEGDKTQNSLRPYSLVLKDVHYGAWPTGASHIAERVLVAEGGWRRVRIDCDDGCKIRQYILDNVVQFQAVFVPRNPEIPDVGRWMVMLETS